MRQIHNELNEVTKLRRRGHHMAGDRIGPVNMLRKVIVQGVLITRGRGSIVLNRTEMNVNGTATRGEMTAQSLGRRVTRVLHRTKRRRWQCWRML